MKVRCGATLKECTEYRTQTGREYFKVKFKITDGPLEKIVVADYIPEFEAQLLPIYYLSELVGVSIASIQSCPEQIEGWEGVIIVTIDPDRQVETEEFLGLDIAWEEIHRGDS